MRTIDVPPERYEGSRDLLKQMHRLRASIFGSRLRWDVVAREGEERDRFDDLRPTYILAVDERERVTGCARLLPACGPTMLSETFPQLLEGGTLITHAGMIESSRFCVDTSIDPGRGGTQLHLATLTLLAGINEWSMMNGYSEIVTATDLRFERILKRAGWPMTRLGQPTPIGSTVAVAGSLPIDEASFLRVQPLEYISQFSLREAHKRCAA